MCNQPSVNSVSTTAIKTSIYGSELPGFGNFISAEDGFSFVVLVFYHSTQWDECGKGCACSRVGTSLHTILPLAIAILDQNSCSFTQVEQAACSKEEWDFCTHIYNRIFLALNCVLNYFEIPGTLHSYGHMWCTWSAEKWNHSLCFWWIIGFLWSFWILTMG